MRIPIFLIPGEEGCLPVSRNEGRNALQLCSTWGLRFASALLRTELAFHAFCRALRRLKEIFLAITPPIMMIAMASSGPAVREKLSAPSPSIALAGWMATAAVGFIAV